MRVPFLGLLTMLVVDVAFAQATAGNPPAAGNRAAAAKSAMTGAQNYRGMAGAEGGQAMDSEQEAALRQRVEKEFLDNAPRPKDGAPPPTFNAMPGKPGNSAEGIMRELENELGKHIDKGAMAPR
jgi:hypothetical protein